MLEWLKAIREEKGLTQEDVAKIIGTSQPTYCSIESEARHPSVKTAKQIGAALGFSWTRFFEEAGQDSA